MSKFEKLEKLIKEIKKDFEKNDKTREEIHKDILYLQIQNIINKNNNVKKVINKLDKIINPKKQNNKPPSNINPLIKIEENKIVYI